MVGVFYTCLLILCCAGFSEAVHCYSCYARPKNADATMNRKIETAVRSISTSSLPEEQWCSDPFDTKNAQPISNCDMCLKGVMTKGDGEPFIMRACMAKNTCNEDTTGKTDKDGIETKYFCCGGEKCNGADSLSGWSFLTVLTLLAVYKLW